MPIYSGTGRICLLTSGIPIQPFQAEFTIFTDASTQCWGTHMVDSQISGTWTHAERKLHIFDLELKAVILALHHWVTLLQATKFWSLRYQHTGWDPFPHCVTSSSGSVSMATNSRHSHKDQTHSGLSDCDSGPSISTKSANNNRVESPPQYGEPNLLNMGNSNSGYVCHSTQQHIFPSLRLRFRRLELWR